MHLASAVQFFSLCSAAAAALFRTAQSVFSSQSRISDLSALQRASQSLSEEASTRMIGLNLLLFKPSLLLLLIRLLATSVRLASFANQTKRTNCKLRKPLWTNLHKVPVCKVFSCKNAHLPILFHSKPAQSSRLNDVILAHHLELAAYKRHK